MNAALLISACTFALQLGLGALLVGVARAPGRRAAGVFALLSFSAAAFSLGNVLTILDPMGGDVRDLGSRLKYCAAGLHVCGWLTYAHGSSEARWRHLPEAVRWLIVLSAVAGGTCLLTGWHAVRGQLSWVEVPWARAT